MSFYRLNTFRCLPPFNLSSHCRTFETNCSALPLPEINWKDIVFNPDRYKQVLIARKNADKCKIIDEIVSLWKKIDGFNSNSIMNNIVSLAASLPNDIHPAIRNYDSDYKLLKVHNTKKDFSFKPISATDLLQGKDLLKISNTTSYTGERSYYFIRDLVKLEQALIKFTLDKLVSKGFELLSVPDIIPEDVILRSGMPIGERTQIYRLHPNAHGKEWCLSGTAEIAIAAFLQNSNIPLLELPKYYTAVSRCYRAEISRLASEKGIYRVHQFTKVEMFGVCLPNQSETLMNEFLRIQEELFSQLDFHYRVIDMAPHELGHHAYRKYDIEAWLPGMNRYGEISSCSNCIDFQARRLFIRSGDQFLHTVNGTACALPRMIAAVSETHQNEDGRVILPEALRSLMKMDILGLRRGPRIIRSTKSPKVDFSNKSNASSS